MALNIGYFVNIKLLLFQLAFFGCSLVIAVPPPLAVAELLGKGKLKGSVTYRENLTKSQHDFYWQGTSNKGGYFEVSVDSRYLNVIDELARKATSDGVLNVVENRAVDKLRKLTKYKFFGKFVESEFRSTIFFTAESQASVMMTTWSFVDAGANITVLTDFLNFEVNLKKASVFLAKAKDNKKVVWKIVWIDEDKQFELYIVDSLDLNGRPIMTLDKVKMIAAQLY